MYSLAALLLLLLLLPLFPAQSPGDSFRRHYEAAEAHRRAGRPAEAEAEFAAILAEGYRELCKVYSAQADYKAEVGACEEAAVRAPDSADALVALSVAYFRAGQYRKALDPLGRVLARDPRHEGARHMLGKSLFMLGEFDRAASELESALELSPRDYDVAYTLGLAHLKRRRLPEARAVYDRMVAQLGEHPQLRVLLGRAYRETGFLAESIEEFRRALALDPRFPRAHYYLGLTYLLKDGADRLDDAAAEFKVELAANPEEFFANYYLGVVYVIQRKWEPAIALLEKASRAQPSNPDPYFHLGQAYQSVERHAEAVEALKKSIALNPSLSHNDYQVTTAHYRLGQSLLKVGRQEEGERELQTASDLKSQSVARDKQKTEAYLGAANLNEPNAKLPEMTSPEGVVADPAELDERTKAALAERESYLTRVLASAHNDVGLLRAEAGDFGGAAVQFAAAARLNPRLEGVDFNLGLAAYKAERYAEAVAPLERELAARPSNVQARQLLGMSYFAAGDFARASGHLSQVAAARPTDLGVNYTLALALVKQGKAEEANAHIRRMVEANGNSPQLHILLGRAYYEQGDTAKSLEELGQALALDPRTPLAHYYSGMIHLKAGRFEEAGREFEAEIALNPADLEARYHLGFVLLARQDSARGIRLMREVVRSKPDFADARYELGKALLQSGDLPGALENLQAAARLAPDKSYVRYQLGRAYLAAGRKAEGEGELETYRRLKEKERTQTTP
ncbi:MAG TPA: tetratricopeptide repeat protein [Pyrinomonadaceae bacterium]|jgi:tetratricopeptide (TPR) repeat protein